MKINHHKKDALDIFSESLKSVDPYQLVGQSAATVLAEHQKSSAGRIVIVGFGKAAVAMGKAAEDSLHGIIDEGILITTRGQSSKIGPLKKMKVLEAGHPIPDENGLNGTEDVIRLLHSADNNTRVLCLISGGGSALLVSPYDAITLEDKQEVTDLLLRAGADIRELNTVRKHISKVKGGRLAELAFPAKVLSLIISDVIGDRLDVIASGPTAPDSTTYDDAIKVLEKYTLTDCVPGPVIDVLRKGAAGCLPETPKEDNPLFVGVENIIIGSNRIALMTAKQSAKEKGFSAEIISSEIRGEARQVAKWLAKKAAEIRNVNSPLRPYCLISGGETTVTVKGNGLGGRNMELALAFAMEIDGIEGITLLSAGTDGIDGPTDAAGAIVDGKTTKEAKKAGIDPSAYLDNNDSYAFFKKAGGLITTGPTGTNVMDMQVIIVDS